MGLKRYLVAGLPLAAAVIGLLPVAAFVEAQAGLPEVDGYYWWVNEVPEIYAESSSYYNGQYPEYTGSASCDGLGCSGIAWNLGNYMNADAYIYFPSVGETENSAYVFDAILYNDSPGGDGGAVYFNSGVRETYCARSSTDTGLSDWMTANCDHISTYQTGVGGHRIQLSVSWQEAPLDWHAEIYWTGALLDTPETTGQLGGGEPWAGTCVFSTTVELEDTPGVTTTQEITYTRPANLVSNGSFEETATGYSPEGWETVVAGTQQFNPAYYQVSSDLARTGSASVYDGWEFELHNPLALFGAGTYEVGYYARCVGDPCPVDGAVTSLWGGSTLATSQSLTETYQVFTDSVSSGGGSQRLIVRFNDGSGVVAVDDVYAIPVDESGGLLCLPELYAPYDPNQDVTIGIGSTPIPTGGAGSTCYYCTPPNSYYETSLGYWFAWLGCVIRNMFSCSLRVWLLRVGNWTAGVVQILLAFMVWIPQTVQSGANWILSTVVASIPGGVVVTTGTNMFDVLIALIDLIRSLIVILSSLLLGVIGKVIGFAAAISGAFAVDPYQFEMGTTVAGPDGSFNLDSGLAVAGPNDDKIMWLFLTFLGLIDQRVIGSYAEIFAVIMGAVSLLIIIWTVTWWKDIVQF